MPRLKPEVLAQRKEHILKAALVSFARKGYHQTTMNEIVAEAGLSKGGVYVHFESKQALFQALLTWSVGQFDALPELNNTGQTPHEQLMTFLDAMMATVTSEGFQETIPLTLEMWALNINDPAVQRTAADLYAGFRQPLTRLIEAALEAGTFQPLDAASLANILIAIPEGLMVQAMIDERAVDWRAISSTLHAMINGLLVIEPPAGDAENEIRDNRLNPGNLQ